MFQFYEKNLNFDFPAQKNECLKIENKFYTLQFHEKIQITIFPLKIVKISKKKCCAISRKNQNYEFPAQKSKNLQIEKKIAVQFYEKKSKYSVENRFHRQMSCTQI